MIKDACAECKPQYFRTEPINLIKATQALREIGYRCQRSTSNSNQNKFILTICDEYSRYLFAFPCRDTSAKNASP